MPVPETEATREHWDAMAATYDAAKSRNDVYYSTLKSCFQRAVPQWARQRVLDVGCGTGQILAALDPVKGVGTDLSANMIDIARQQFASRKELVFLAADGSAVAGLGEFDAVISADVMEHVEDWKKVVTTIVKACRPGGIIAISTPSPRWTFPLWVLEKLRLKMPEGPHCFVPARHIADHLRDSNCDVLSNGTSALLPVRLGGLGPRISARAERWPVLRGLGVIQMVVAQRKSGD